ncbi:MAG: metal ABC transporter ATP-binding protein [Chitinispirillia bacterium]|nr:metal ABC transporter ATP-binding protein [Chitinispirillia bacterium]MCL2268921.1 metal ABC transporter ATP-binding protein [Chitinispirillia bacterium]
MEVLTTNTELSSPATCGGCCTKISSLSVSSGNTTIIDGVNLHFHCGEFSVITGPNGAGKTTLLRAIAGELPFTGEIFFHRYGDNNNERMKPRIGYVPQKIAFDPAAPMTVEDLFALSLTSRPRWLFRDKKVKKAALDSLGAVDAAHLISRKLGCLSGGELQRVILSLALTPRPDILLLDEPVSGIDAAGLNLFYAMISELRAKYDLSIVMVSHDLSRSAKYADRLIFFNRTVVCSGTPGEILRDRHVREFFGTVIIEERLSDGSISHHLEGRAG